MEVSGPPGTKTKNLSGYYGALGGTWGFQEAPSGIVKEPGSTKDTTKTCS